MLRTMKSERDRLMLREEMLRLKARGYCFNGQTESERLGVDAWMLGIAVVDEKQNWKRKKRLSAALSGERALHPAPLLSWNGLEHRF